MTKKESRLKAKLQLAWTEIESLKALLKKKQEPIISVAKKSVKKTATKKPAIRQTKRRA